MALAVVLGVIFGHIRKKGVGHEGGRAPMTREFLSANTLFYGFLFVGILRISNWFNLLSPDFTGTGTATSLVWTFIDAALPLLLGVMGLVEAGPADVRLHHSRHSLAVHQVTAPW